jgi:hypothetical protein
MNRKKERAFKNQVGGSMLLRLSEEIEGSVVQGLFCCCLFYHDATGDLSRLRVCERAQYLIYPCLFRIIQHNLLLLGR